MSSHDNLYQHLGILIRGRAVHALLSLAATALLTRALSIDEFGTVVLVHLFLLSIRAVLQPCSHLWVIRFGMPLLGAKDKTEAGRLFALARQTDRRSARLSVLIAMLLAPVVGGLLGWEPHLVLVVVALCTLLLTGGTGLSLGYLQIRRNSRALNLPVIAGVATRLVGTFAGWIAGSPMEVFMVIWAASIAVEYWLLDHAGRAEMKRDGIELEGLPAVSLDSVPGLKAFARIGRIQVLLDQVPQRLSTLVVGAGLGSGPGGLYRVCAECTTVLSRPTLMLKQSVLPEFVRLVDVAVADVLRMLFTLMMVATAIGGVVIMVVWWYGDLLLRVLFGPEFVVATPLLCWLLVAASIEFIGAALCPAGQALARSGSILICQAAGLAVMVLLQIPLQLAYGLHGAGVAVAFGAAVYTFSASCVILLATLRIRSSPSPENAVLHRPVESTHRL